MAKSNSTAVKKQRVSLRAIAERVDAAAYEISNAVATLRSLVESSSTQPGAGEQINLATLCMVDASGFLKDVLARVHAATGQRGKALPRCGMG